MTEVIQNKFSIIKWEDMDKYLTKEEINQFGDLYAKIAKGRLEDGKSSSNNYWVVNQDEPYAQDILDLILAGEGLKEEINNDSNKM